jgi:hypothetical protein
LGIRPLRIISNHRLLIPVARETTVIDAPGSESFPRTKEVMSVDSGDTLAGQSFAQCIRNTLREATAIVDRMTKPLVQVVADNILAAYGVSTFHSENEPAKAASVAPNTLRNLMHPDRRAPNARGEASPRLDVLGKVAKALGYEPWQLMVEDFRIADPPYSRPLTNREVEIYRQWADAYRSLPPLASSPRPSPPEPDPQKDGKPAPA